ncbi:hypothetical protein KIH39_03660 [Telmatocola sphagniphila]|uniref:Carboxypeptidase regulatory-like domain-containing protein n=1 Tax=Telmatocola sphagniphila TaxID=1123043 RepID=A0A8E6B849_9BACT|nr:hypothetical protein [Telmatocola sphagniphila]QVL33024.1 hypothetical protein KIH39_03660 [Telmatocola sphagniphila]
MRFSFLSTSVLLVCCVALLGCGEKKVKRVTLEGTITIKGKPLDNGIVKFHGDKGLVWTAIVHEGGKFIITDVVPGAVKVSLTESPQSFGSSSDGKDKHNAGKLPSFDPVMKKLMDPDTANLHYTITEDQKEIHIEVT